MSTIAIQVPTSATSYLQDPLSRDLVSHISTGTGSEIGAASDATWASRFGHLTQLMRWEAASWEFPGVIKLSVSSDVSLEALHVCARAVTQALNSTALVPPVFRFTALLDAVSDFNFCVGDSRFEVEGTLASSEPASLSTEGQVSSTHNAPSPESSLPAHARLAQELREMTGLSATTLGGVFGVSREQYSRWVSGKPISDSRHGQLQFLHTLVRELNRRLGSAEAKVWLHQPLSNLSTPIDLLSGRRFDRFYQEVVALPGAESAAVSAKLALTAPVPMPEEGLEDQDAPWSPYD